MLEEVTFSSGGRIVKARVAIVELGLGGWWEWGLGIDGIVRGWCSVRFADMYENSCVEVSEDCVRRRKLISLAVFSLTMYIVLFV